MRRLIFFFTLLVSLWACVSCHSDFQTRNRDVMNALVGGLAGAGIVIVVIIVIPTLWHKLFPKNGK